MHWTGGLICTKLPWCLILYDFRFLMRGKLFEDLQSIGLASSHHKERFSSQELDKCLSKTEKCSKVTLFLFGLDVNFCNYNCLFLCSPMGIFGGFTFEEGSWLDVNTKKPSGNDPLMI